MKIAVTADLHLRNSGERPERYNALENIFEQAAAESIEHVFIAGDLFDKDFRDYSEFEALCNKYNKFQLHIIPGNHDPNISGKSIVGDNIQIYTAPTVIEIDSTTVLFIPYEEKVLLGEKIAEKEAQIVGKNWILVAHGDFYEGVKEQNPQEPGVYMPISRKDLDRFNPRIVLLGHSHQPFSQGKVHFPGSPCGLGINDKGKRSFLVYDTSDENIFTRVVNTDILFFDESFIIVPADNELAFLQQEIRKRIEFWNIDPSDYAKVRVRVKAKGYVTDKGAILATLKQGFEKFIYFNDEGPMIDELSVSSDHQLAAIAEQTTKLIDELDWPFGGNEPTKDQVKIAALFIIYKD